MSISQRGGYGALIRIGGPKNDTNVPMSKLALDRQINELVLLKPRNHQGSPRTLAGTGGFKIKNKTK